MLALEKRVRDVISRGKTRREQRQRKTTGEGNVTTQGQTKGKRMFGDEVKRKLAIEQMEHASGFCTTHQTHSARVSGEQGVGFVDEQRPTIENQPRGGVCSGPLHGIRRCDGLRLLLRARVCAAGHPRFCDGNCDPQRCQDPARDRGTARR